MNFAGVGLLTLEIPASGLRFKIFKYDENHFKNCASKDTHL